MTNNTLRIRKYTDVFNRIYVRPKTLRRIQTLERLTTLIIEMAESVACNPFNKEEINAMLSAISLVTKRENENLKEFETTNQHLLLTSEEEIALCGVRNSFAYNNLYLNKRSRIGKLERLGYELSFSYKYTCRN